MVETQNSNYNIEKTLTVYFISGMILGLILSISLKLWTFLLFLLTMIGAIQGSIISWIFFYILVIIPNRNGDKIPYVGLILIMTSSVVLIPTIIISYGIVNLGWFDKLNSMILFRPPIETPNNKNNNEIMDKIIQKKRLQHPPSTSNPELDEYFWSLYIENLEKSKIIRMLTSWISNKAVELGENKSYFDSTNEAREYYKKIEKIEKELNEQKQ